MQYTIHTSINHKGTYKVQWDDTTHRLKETQEVMQRMARLYED